MAVRIEIYTTSDAGLPEKEQIDQSMIALGFVRQSYLGERRVAVENGKTYLTHEDLSPPGLIEGGRSTVTGDVEVQSGQADVKRERGKPAPGRARRTKEEIAEDEAADKAEAATGQTISTGGERVGPEDDAATQEQDKADEQAEVAASRDTVKPLTIDDVKQAVGLYVAKHGLPATNEDGPNIFTDVLGAPPEGNPFWKMSILPDDQKKLAVCVKAWTDAAAAETRYGA
jgi:hypothetical protein